MSRTAILWDDYHANLSAAYSAGWGVIPMPNIKKCTNPVGNGKFDKGITQEQIDLFLNNSLRNGYHVKIFIKQIVVIRLVVNLIGIITFRSKLFLLIKIFSNL